MEYISIGGGASGSLWTEPGGREPEKYPGVPEIYPTMTGGEHIKYVADILEQPGFEALVLR